jgi:predicted amidophosphoribosyltransferase
MPASLRPWLDLVIPPACLICGSAQVDRRSAEDLCASCIVQLLPVGEPPVVFRDPAQGVGALFVGWAASHEAACARAVARLKFEGCHSLAPVLARRMRVSMPPGPWDLAVPIPVHPHRLRHRGVAQANLLAAGMAGRRELRFAPLLRRLDRAPPRAELNAQERRRSLPSFAVKEGASLGRTRVMLVDDVVTTGLTLLAAAKVCLESGAHRVGAVVFSRALQGSTGPS